MTKVLYVEHNDDNLYMLKTRLSYGTVDAGLLRVLVIRARAEKWLRRHLWTLAFDSLSPLEQGVCVVIDSAMRYRLRPARTSLFCG